MHNNNWKQFNNPFHFDKNYNQSAVPSNVYDKNIPVSFYLQEGEFIKNNDYRNILMINPKYLKNNVWL